MDRRAFIAVVTCGLVVVPPAARAQTAITVRRIGILESGAPPTPAELQKTYSALRQLGWYEGKNLIIEELAPKARQVHVLFNNNYQNQGQRGAASLTKLLHAG